MKVLKFGGSSVGSVERIGNVISILKDTSKKSQFVVVFSAFQGVTDLLIKASQQAKEQDTQYLKTFKELQTLHLRFSENLNSGQRKIIEEHLQDLRDLLKGIFLIKECSPKTADAIVSFGERMANIIISGAMNASGLKSEYLDARLLIKTDNNFTNAEVDFDASYKNIKQHFKNCSKIAVITGFIGSTEDNCTTTLGRGGSDYTASIFGAALNCNVIEIWTDVDGVLSADPRKVKDAFVLNEISYEEAMEMSHFGAKVLHPKTMAPAIDKKIPIYIKNTFNPQFVGTKIWQKSSPNQKGVKGVTSMRNITLLSLQGTGMMGMPGIASRLFKSIASQNINVILISQASSEHSICFAVQEQDSNSAIKTIESEFKLEIQAKMIQKVGRTDQLCILAIVGDNMKGSIGIAGKLFQSIGRNGVNIIAIAQGSSERNISFVIDAKDEALALNSIHDAFFLSETQIHIFIAGTGLVGTELLKQIQDNKEKLKTQFGINVIVNGIMNSKKMIIEKNGINLKSWQKNLGTAATKSDIKQFLLRANEAKLHNSIFVDCTSNEDIAKMYSEIFSNNLHIVTPNKKANSGPYQQYKKIHFNKKKFRKEFLYETNVGAGLPVISTLQDLIKSGDKIIKIEGILSGTLSYIFNNFSQNNKFSDVVKMAKEKGYTEPDPRDDLSGQDFARKMLILAREIGYTSELTKIEVENLSPTECQKAKNVDEFLALLQKHDQSFEQRRASAEKKNCVLRYVGKIENNRIKIKLEEVNITHPFASLAESDNIISFTTERYNTTPLIVRGPGAGANVTAAGVLADILKVAHNLE